MITITNKLETCLVVPDGLGQKGALTLAPKGRAKVDELNASLNDAERKGLLKISYPTEKKTGKTDENSKKMTAKG